MKSQTTNTFLQPIHTILVCLDLTEADPPLIQYASNLAQTLSAEKVIFFHAIQAYDLPDRSSKDFPNVETELKGIIRRSIHHSVDSHFENDCHWEIVTRPVYEDAAREIVDYVETEEIDLTMIGQKYGENRRARYGHEITAHANSDILFAPQDTQLTVAPLVCAIDFSDASIKAFERALDITRALAVQLICYAISDPARAYFPASTERSSEYDKTQSRKAFDKFIEQYGLSPDKVSCRINSEDGAGSEAENIYTAAVREEAGLIIVGASGGTEKVTSLLGNLYESFRLMEKEIPVMIVKHESKRKFPWFWKEE